MPSVRSVSLGFWIGTGSRYESEAEAGLSHLLEHLLFKGTAKYESLQIDQIFDGMGAELNAGTGKETTSVYARVIDEHLADAFDVMADMVFRPALTDIESEREVILEEIAMYEDDPQEKVFDMLGEAVFGDRPAGPGHHRARRGHLGHPGGRHRALSPRPLPAPRTSSSRPPAPSTTTRWWRWRASAVTRPSPTAPGPRRPRRPITPPWSPLGRAALRAQGHRAVPRLPGRHRALAPRRPPLRPARAGHHLRRHLVEPPVSGGPRAPRPGVLRVLVHQRLLRHRPGRALRRHAGRQPGPGAVGGRHRARALPRRAGHRRGAPPRQGEPQGARRAGAGVHRGADEPARLRDPGRLAADGARRGRGAHRRGHARRPGGAHRRAVGARAPVGGRHRSRGRALRRGARRGGPVLAEIPSPEPP